MDSTSDNWFHQNSNELSSRGRSQESPSDACMIRVTNETLRLWPCGVIWLESEHIVRNVVSTILRYTDIRPLPHIPIENGPFGAAPNRVIFNIHIWGRGRRRGGRRRVARRIIISHLSKKPTIKNDENVSENVRRLNETEENWQASLNYSKKEISNVLAEIIWQ